MTTDGLPGFPRDTCPDIMGRDLPTVSNPDPCGGGDLPSVWDKSIEPGAHDSVAVKAGSLADDARELVDGQRQADYGEPTSHLRRVAECWAAVLNRPFTAEEVALCLASLKLVREGYRPNGDNRVDAVGYLEILERLRTDSP